jgi:hypothetical protein
MEQGFQINQVNTSPLLLSTAYLPPVTYLQCLANNQEIWIESKEHYQKQSYRNRAHITSNQGLQSLLVPVKHVNASETIDEVKIEFKHSWQKQHIGAIQTAYGQYPYFEYFASDYFNLIRNAPEKLFEFNLLIINQLCTDLNVSFQPKFTEIFLHDTKNKIDLRNKIHPKEQFLLSQSVKGTDYHNGQVSVLELLFDHGPDGWKILEAMQFYTKFN